MADIDPQIAALEAQSLETHVAVNHERFRKLDQSIARLEGLVEKQGVDIKEDINELKKVIIWAASTLFGTMLIALFTSIFKVI